MSFSEYALSHIEQENEKDHNHKLVNQLARIANALADNRLTLVRIANALEKTAVLLESKQTADTKPLACRNFDPWSCTRNSDGEEVNPDDCMICGMPEESHG